MADDVDPPDLAAWPHGPLSNPIDRYLHLPEYTRRFMEQLRENEVDALSDFAHLPAWKRKWFGDLSQRDVEIIFPSTPAELEEWMKDRTHGRNRRRAWDKVGQLIGTSAVSLIVMAIAGALWLGIKGSLK
jgi:hypothetical protein